MSETGATSSLAAMRGTTLCQTPNRELLLLLHPFNGLFSRTTWVRRYQKSKSILHLNQARDDGVLGCSGISWTICKQSAPRSRQITMPTPHHSIFTGRMPTNSVTTLKAYLPTENYQRQVERPLLFSASQARCSTIDSTALCQTISNNLCTD